MNNYNDLFIKITSAYSEDELLKISKILNKTYNVFDSNELMWKHIYYVFDETSYNILNEIKAIELANKFINDLIFRYYKCERVIKYYFIRDILMLKNQIVAFESYTGDSRIDICRINGHSYAYEIKTEYDSFDRLNTQMNDYMKTFDYVYLIVPITMKSIARKHIPSGCGIITYSDKNQGIKFSYNLKAIKNKIDIDKCIDNLSSNDLNFMLKLMNIQKIPSSKDDRIEAVKKHYNNSAYNIYKKVMKEKYRVRWEYLFNNFEKIIPIDIQAFFNSNINPESIYFKGGS